MSEGAALVRGWISDEAVDFSAFVAFSATGLAAAWVHICQGRGASA